MTELELAEQQLTDAQDEFDQLEARTKAQEQKVRGAESASSTTGLDYRVLDSLRRDRKAAQGKVTEAGRTVALLRTRQAKEAAAKEADHQKETQAASRDDASFWFRRFMLSLQLGNGGAFLGIVSGVLQADDPALVAGAAAEPALFFWLGLIAAGVLPLFLWAERATSRWWISATAHTGVLVATFLSSSFFLVGSSTALINLKAIATRNAPAAQTIAVPPPTSPSASARASGTPSSPAETPPPPAHKTGPQDEAGQTAAGRKGDRG